MTEVLQLGQVSGAGWLFQNYLNIILLYSYIFHVKNTQTLHLLQRSAGDGKRLACSDQNLKNAGEALPVSPRKDTDAVMPEMARAKPTAATR
jgi:hypothetical protein